MSFYQELPYPVFIANGGVLQSGGSENLKAGQLALINTETQVALSAGAPAATNPEVVIAGGSWHSKDSLTRYIGGLKQSIKTQEFLGKDVQEFHVSRPNELTQDIVQIGWDGVNDCDGLTFECGKPKTFKVTVSGEDVYRTFQRPLYRFISVPTGCCDDTDCSDGCDNRVSPEKYARKLADLINNDVELQYFVKAEAVIDGYTSPSDTYTVYHLQVCDNGDYGAQAQVENAYPTNTITRIGRTGSTSIYELTKLTGAPATFTPTQPVLQSVCGTCPAGYSTQAARSYWVVSRPLAGTEDLDSANDRQTYANTVTTAYSGSGGKFLGQNGAVATVGFYGALGATVTAINSDTVSYSNDTPAVCIPPAGSAISWTAFETRYRPTRYLYLTLAKTCGGANRLAAVQAAYPTSFEDIVPSSIIVSASGECADTYRVTQYSKEALNDGCLSPAVATYGDVQAFEGFSWSPDAPCPADEDADLDKLVGVRITGSYVDTRFGNCSFELTDYYSQSPIRVNISEVNEDGSPCSEGAKVTVLQRGQKASQSGEWLIRQYLKASSLEAYNIWSNEPRLREVYDQNVLSFIDRNKLYKVYYIVYKQNRDGANWDSQHTKDKFETLIAFELGADTSTFEQVFGGYFAQFGVVLKDRGVKK